MNKIPYKNRTLTIKAVMGTSRGTTYYLQETIDGKTKKYIIGSKVKEVLLRSGIKIAEWSEVG